jgi:hypothetical protein
MLITPDTLSPGYLVLKYQTAGRIHRLGKRLVWGVDMEGVTALEAVASDWAAVTAAMLPDNCSVNGWELHDPDHIRLYENDWAVPVTGTHATASGGEDGAQSKTIAFGGKGVGPSVYNLGGQWLCRLFVDKAYVFTRGQKVIGKAYDAGTAGMWAFLDTCGVGPADFYGQHVEVRTLLPVQYNGFAQNHWGE